jgi:hypothetical protein
MHLAMPVNRIALDAELSLQRVKGDTADMQRLDPNPLGMNANLTAATPNPRLTSPGRRFKRIAVFKMISHGSTHAPACCCFLLIPSIVKTYHNYSQMQYTAAVHNLW